MSIEMSGNHPIRRYFTEALHTSLTQLDLDESDVENYLAEMMVRFLHRDALYGIRDARGRRVESVAEMVVEADVRLNANSFDREREVHRHIGDFLLFWSGVYPEYLKFPSNRDGLLDPVRQGRYSYHLVSTFDHGDYAKEAPVFRRLSAEFEGYLLALRLLRERFNLPL